MGLRNSSWAELGALDGDYTFPCPTGFIGLRNISCPSIPGSNVSFPCPTGFIGLRNPSLFSGFVTCDDTPPPHVTTLPSTFQSVTQTTFRISKPLNSTNALHATRGFQNRTRFGVHVHPNKYCPQPVSLLPTHTPAVTRWPQTAQAPPPRKAAGRDGRGTRAPSGALGGRTWARAQAGTGRNGTPQSSAERGCSGGGRHGQDKRASSEQPTGLWNEKNPGPKPRKGPLAWGFVGRPPGARTLNPRIKSPLRPLQYTPLCPDSSPAAPQHRHHERPPETTEDRPVPQHRSNHRATAPSPKSRIKSVGR